MPHQVLVKKSSYHRAMYNAEDSLDRRDFFSTAVSPGSHQNVQELQRHTKVIKMPGATPYFLLFYLSPLHLDGVVLIPPLIEPRW